MEDTAVKIQNIQRCEYRSIIHAFLVMEDPVICREVLFIDDACHDGGKQKVANVVTAKCLSVLLSRKSVKKCMSTWPDC